MKKEKKYKFKSVPQVHSCLQISQISLLQRSLSQTKIYPEITAPNKKKNSFLTRAFYKIIKVKIEKTTTVQLGD